ncbi:MAG TPA: RNA polymerase sigma factor [bacterium]|jgi:RNA polymerase sigma-70 factor (ECF subfamily)
MISFHDLYQRHAQDVYRFAYWLCGDVAEAEDIAAETFVRAWTASDHLQTQTVKAYLLTIARHLYLQGRKRQARQVALDEQMESATPDPAQAAETRSELDAVAKVLSTLPDVDRAVLLMRAQDGMSYEDIAAASGISVAAAKVKVHRARLKLARLRTPEEPR